MIVILIIYGSLPRKFVNLFFWDMNINFAYLYLQQRYGS